MRILIADCDTATTRLLAPALHSAGFVAENASTPDDAWFLVDTEEYSATILGVRSGGAYRELLQRWRRSHRYFPILALGRNTNLDTWIDVIDRGADTFLPLPFVREELLSRLEAIVRRSYGHLSSRLTANEVQLDRRKMVVTVSGRVVNLTAREFSVLSQLMYKRGTIVSSHELAESTFHESSRTTNAVEATISRLRRKIGHHIIETRRSAGYLIKR